MIKEQSAFVAVRGFNIYYRSWGDSNVTLVCLHGGPGSTHEYLITLSKLAESGLRVVMYDQLGCGQSDSPKDNLLFTIESAAEEVEQFRRELNLGKVHLLGQSYGGFLALEYTLRYPESVRTLILSNTAASVPKTVREMNELRTKLPARIRSTLRKYESADDLQNPEYLAAVKYLYQKHVCRLRPWPPEVEKIFVTWNQRIYQHMWGPNEFYVTGNLKNWDVSARLNEIKIPTLILVGKHDELPPPLSVDMHRRIRGSKLVTFARGSHLLMFEEPERYITTIKNFIGTSQLA